MRPARVPRWVKAIFLPPPWLTRGHARVTSPGRFPTYLASGCGRWSV